MNSIKQTFTSILFVCLVTLGAVNANAKSTVGGGTTLAAGDIAFTGYNSNGSNDTFAIILLKDISAGTQISFTDGNYSTSTGKITINGSAQGYSEFYFTWEATSSMTANTQIKFWAGAVSGSNPRLGAASAGTILASSFTNGPNSISLSASGDQIFAYQGGTYDFAGFTITPTTFLAGIHMNTIVGTTSASNWDGSTIGVNASSLPSSLTNGVNAVWVYDVGPVEKQNAAVKCSVSLTGSAATIRIAVNNVNNWDLNSSTTLYSLAPRLDCLPANTAPTFTNSSPQVLSVCQNVAATSINSLLTVSDADASQTETWSVPTGSGPSHGTLGGFNATAGSGSTSITPTGLTYTPTAGYSGSDAFTIQVSDGTATASMVVNVTVNALPTITLGSNPSISSGPHAFKLTYSATTQFPDLYSITWDAGTGFVDVSLAPMVSSYLTISVPSNPGVGSYTGILTVKNSTTGCSSSGSSMGVTITNIAPTFVNGSTEAITTCKSTKIDIKNNLTVSDLDPSQALTWSVSTNPAHGTLAVVGLIHQSGSDSITPSNSSGPSYTPSSFYSGPDQFIIKVTDGIASAFDTINVTVNPSTVITTQPVSPSFCAGSNQDLTVGATGTGTLSYLWKENSGSGYVALTDGGIYSGSTTSTLSLTNVPASYDGYKYECVVTGGCSSATTNTNQVIAVKPTFTISASAMGGMGSISSPGNTTVCKFNSQFYTITPLSGFDITDVLVDGVSKGAITSFNFTNVQADHTIDALFVAQNVAPVFSNSSPQGLTVCGDNTTGIDFSSLLAITDANENQTETFSVTSGPTNGTIVTGTTVNSGFSVGGFRSTNNTTKGNILKNNNVSSSDVAPTGWSYVPLLGSKGSDAFTIQVSDGNGGTANITFNVTINQPTTAIITDTSRDSYTWHDSTYSVSTTTSTFDSLNAAGCDSLTTLHLTIIPAINTWTGTKSTDWSDPANWSSGVVPDSLQDIIIPNVSNKPVNNGTLTANNLIIESGATIINNGTLNVYGNFTDSGNFVSTNGSKVVLAGTGTVSGSDTFANLEIKGDYKVMDSIAVKQRLIKTSGTLNTNNRLTLISDSTGSALIEDDGGNLIGKSHLQHYAGGKFGYHHFATPVAGTTVNDWSNAFPIFGPDGEPAWLSNRGSLQIYNEPANKTVLLDSSYYNYTNLSNQLVPGQGYTAWLNSLPTLNTFGIPNNGAVSYPVTLTDTANATTQGWNLVGNPYPSPISWKALRDLPSNAGLFQDASCYLWQADGDSTNGNWATFDGSVGANGAGDIINSSLGFFVYVNKSGNLNFDNSVRNYDYTSPEIFGTKSNAVNTLRLSIRAQGSKLADEVVAYTSHQASFSRKMPQPATATNPTIAFDVKGTKAAINVLTAIDSKTELPITVLTPKAGTYTLSLNTKNIDLPVYLKDGVTGIYTELSASTTITTSAKETSGRYSLVFSQPTVDRLPLTVAPNPARDVVTVNGSHIAFIQVVDNLGRVMKTVSLKDATNPVLSVKGLTSGAYHLRVQTTDGKVSGGNLVVSY